jgi:ribosome maturation factor RimP
MEDLENSLTEVLGPIGLEVLEVRTHKDQGSLVLLVRVDRLDEQPVTTEDLATASQVAGLELDRIAPFPDRYRLDLESPGPQRPLLRRRHFERMLGLKAKVSADGHKFTAPIAAVAGELVTFATQPNPTTLALGTFRAELAEWPDHHR